VPTAETIVVGEVENSGSGFDDSFRLHVHLVLRGSAPDIMRIDNLRSGLPLTICPQDSVAWAQDGDQLAIAFDAKGPDAGTRINAIALVGSQVDEGHAFLMPGVKSITLAELRVLVTMPDTGTEPLAPDPTSTSPTALVLSIAGLAAFVVTMWMKKFRTPEPVKGRRGRA
jgi:hypothetical protein